MQMGWLRGVAPWSGKITQCGGGGVASKDRHQDVEASLHFFSSLCGFNPGRVKGMPLKSRSKMTGPLAGPRPRRLPRLKIVP